MTAAAGGAGTAGATGTSRTLGTSGAAPRIVRLASVGSTNDEAMAALREGLGPLWLVAGEQLAGRGRRGRTWVSKPGNLYASYGTDAAFAPGHAVVLPLAAASALAEGIERVTGLEPRVKWPNDVLIEGRKVSGILIEREASGDASRTVIGFGVNVAHHPDALAATHLAAHGPCNLDRLFEALAAAVAEALAVLGRPDGIAATRQRWLARAAGVGESIIVRLPTHERRGRFVGLDESGRLILEEPTGVAHISAGDVFLATEHP